MQGACTATDLEKLIIHCAERGRHPAWLRQEVRKAKADKLPRAIMIYQYSLCRVPTRLVVASVDYLAQIIKYVLGPAAENPEAVWVSLNNTAT